MANQSSLSESVVSSYEDLRDSRDSSEADLCGIGNTARKAIRFLNEEANFRHWESVPDRDFFVFEPNGWDGDKGELSRLIRPDLMITDDTQYNHLWQEVRDKTRGQSDSLSHPRLEEIIYTTVISYASTKDMLTGGSDRKSTGNFLEIVVENLIKSVTGLSIGGKITVTENFDVPVDIHVYREGDGDRKLALPTKMSLRERSSQPYVHHFLLDAGSKEYDVSEFKTALFVVSDYQRYKDTVQLTTTPDQISLYQKYLAPIDSFYFLDKNKTLEDGSPFPSSKGKDLEIKSYKEFFEDDLPEYADWIKNGQG